MISFFWYIFRFHHEIFTWVLKIDIIEYFYCPEKSCCRNADGSILSSSSGGWGGWLGSISYTTLYYILYLQNYIIGENEIEETCSTLPNQLGETCEFGCGCGNGLTCYRPMTGIL